MAIDWSRYPALPAAAPFAVANAREGGYSIAGNGVFDLLRGKERPCNMMTLIIVYLVGLLLWFLLLWYGGCLSQLLLGIPFLLLIVVGSIFSICYAVKKCVKKNPWKVRLASMIPFAVSGVAVGLMFCPLKDWKGKVDHALFLKQRMAFIREIPRQGPSHELVRLPHWWLAEDGEATVYRSDGKILVDFFVTRGMLCPHRGVVYTEKDTPPTEDELLSGGVEIRQELAPHWYFMHIR